MADRRAHTRSASRPVALAARAALAAVVLAGAAACSSGGNRSDAQPDADPDAVSDAADPTPTPAPTAAAPVELAAFTTIDRQGWDAIAADPEAAAGQQVVVYAVVEWFFSATGPGVLQAAITTSQPADPTEGTGAVVRADPALLDGVEAGDVVQLHAQVAGTFGGATGATNRVPELQGYAVEEVGYRDLSTDVALGAPVTGGGGVTVPVIITNSGDVTMEYRVDVMATSADGTQAFGTVTARGNGLVAGQSAQTSVRFTGGLPSGVVFTLTSITRAPTPAALTTT